MSATVISRMNPSSEMYSIDEGRESYLNPLTHPTSSSTSSAGQQSPSLRKASKYSIEEDIDFINHRLPSQLSPSFIDRMRNELSTRLEKGDCTRGCVWRSQLVSTSQSTPLRRHVVELLSSLEGARLTGSVILLLIGLVCDEDEREFFSPVVCKLNVCRCPVDRADCTHPHGCPLDHYEQYLRTRTPPHSVAFAVDRTFEHFTLKLSSGDDCVSVDNSSLTYSLGDGPVAMWRGMHLQLGPGTDINVVVEDKSRVKDVADEIFNRLRGRGVEMRCSDDCPYLFRTRQCGEGGVSSGDVTTAAYVIMMSPVIPCGMSEEEMKDYALRYLSFYRVVVFWKPSEELYESEISLWQATLDPLSNTLDHSSSFVLSLLDRRLHFLNRTDTSNTHGQALTDGYWLSLVFKYMMRGYESTLELGYNGALNLALNLPLNLLVDASS